MLLAVIKPGFTSKKSPLLSFLFSALFSLSGAASLYAQPLVTIDTVTVGDAGNAADTTGYGAVNYAFSIGKYEVTISQYNTFLNSVASVTSDSYIVNLWNTQHNDPLEGSGRGISRSGAGTLASPYSYSVIGSGNRPISFVSWFDAARFANWINNGATNGASTEAGAYTLNGATSGIITANPGAIWRLPTEDEWYKAAYYKGGGTNAGYWVYPTQSDTAPGNNIGGAANQANYYAGDYAVTQQPQPRVNTQNYLTDVGAFSNSASAYGTFDQGGNLFEWNDAVINDSRRGFRGGQWAGDEVLLQSSSRVSLLPWSETTATGFRLASAASPGPDPAAVPEPGQIAASLLLLGGIGGYVFLKRRKAVKATV
jgi:sulfatase modifying factor 1